MPGARVTDGAPNFGSIEELWRRAMELNMRYYSAVGQLTADYLKNLVTVLGDVRGRPAESGAPSAAPAAAAAAPSAPARPVQPAAAMVLEGEAGGEAMGVFLVENHLSHEIATRVTASAFTDEAGRRVQPALAFDPAQLQLGPGEQLLVRVTATIDPSLEPGVRYRGELTIPELQGTRVPVILRRRRGGESPGAAPSGAAPKRHRTRARTRASRPQRTRRG